MKLYTEIYSHGIEIFVLELQNNLMSLAFPTLIKKTYSTEHELEMTDTDIRKVLIPERLGAVPSETRRQRKCNV